MRQIAGFALLILVGTSCVTNKKFQLLQKDDVNKQQMPSDTVLRRYTLQDFNYKVQTNDILSVRFESLSPKEFDFLSKGMDPVAGNAAFVGGALLVGDLVDEHGEIPFPVVGKVRVAGMTVFEIQEALQKTANQYLESPVVKVRLLNYRFTIIGEVNKEGTITMTNNRVSLLEAIGLAGGMTDLADKSSVKLIRQSGNQTKVVYLNLLDEAFITSPYFFIHQNDVLIVPALKQRPFRKYFGQNLSLIISSLSLFVIVLTYTKN